MIKKLTELNLMESLYVLKELQMITKNNKKAQGVFTTESALFLLTCSWNHPKLYPTFAQICFPHIFRHFLIRSKYISHN